MLPPDGVLAAAHRWIELLRAGASVEQTWSVIRNDPACADLSTTQYATAFDWLTEIGVVTELSKLSSVPEDLLFVRALTFLDPVWLSDFDALIGDAADLPMDAVQLANLFAIPEDRVLRLIRRIGRKVDPEMARMVGLAGESALIMILNEVFPGCVIHASLVDDSLGYDIKILLEGEIHLEVKSTTRRGRLIVYLSRHEFEVAAVDDAWAMVVLGLDSTYQLAVIATANRRSLFDRVPKDVSRFGRWDSVALELRLEDLQPGVVVRQRQLLPELAATCDRSGSGFAWMPTCNTQCRL